MTVQAPQQQADLFFGGDSRKRDVPLRADGFELRPYQEAAVSNVIADWRHGHDANLVFAPTGLGKTIMGGEIVFRAWRDARETSEPVRFCWLAHTRELIFQPIERFNEFWPAMGIEAGIVMAEHGDVDAGIVVATIQTLSAPGRLDEVLNHGAFTHLFIDEAHHCVADTYMVLVERLREANPDLKIAGLTATPNRSDNVSIRQVFKHVSFTYEIETAVRDGWLTPYNGIEFVIEYDYDRDVPEGNRPDNSLNDVLDAENVHEIIFDKWQKYAADRPTLAFTPSVYLAHRWADYFQAHGVAAAAIDGTTPKGERDRILARYRRGEIRIIFNVFVLVEGFDAPATSCIYILRPIGSVLVLRQMLGRGLRPADNKDDCLILSAIPQTDLPSLAHIDDALSGSMKRLERQTQEAEDDGVLISFSMDRWGQMIAVDPDEVHARVVDWMTQSTLAWVAGETMSTAAVNETDTIVVVPPQYDRVETADAMRRTGTWEATWDALYEWANSFRVWVAVKPKRVAVRKDKDGNVTKWQYPKAYAELLGRTDTFDEAKALAEEYARENLDAKLARRGEKWRLDPPSPGQMKWFRGEDAILSDADYEHALVTLASKFGHYEADVRDFVDRDDHNGRYYTERARLFKLVATKGTASQYIGHGLAIRTVRRAERAQEARLLSVDKV